METFLRRFDVIAQSPQSPACWPVLIQRIDDNFSTFGWSILILWLDWSRVEPHMAGKERMFAFDSKMFFVIPSFLFFWSWNGKTRKNFDFCFWNGYDQSRYQKKTQWFLFLRLFNAENQTYKCWKPKKLSFLVFWYLDWSYPFKKQRKCFLVFFILKPKKLYRENQKKIFWVKTKHALIFCFLVLLEFFVFFGLSIGSHDCHLCPYACLPYRSWEVKLWPKFLTQELAHYVGLSLA